MTSNNLTGYSSFITFYLNWRDDEIDLIELAIEVRNDLMHVKFNIYSSVSLLHEHNLQDTINLVLNGNEVCIDLGECGCKLSLRKHDGHGHIECSLEASQLGINKSEHFKMVSIFDPIEIDQLFNQILSMADGHRDMATTVINN